MNVLITFLVLCREGAIFRTIRIELLPSILLQSSHEVKILSLISILFCLKHYNVTSILSQPTSFLKSFGYNMEHA